MPLHNPRHNRPDSLRDLEEAAKAAAAKAARAKRGRGSVGPKPARPPRAAKAAGAAKGTAAFESRLEKPRKRAAEIKSPPASFRRRRPALLPPVPAPPVGPKPPRPPGPFDDFVLGGFEDAQANSFGGVLDPERVPSFQCTALFPSQPQRRCERLIELGSVKCFHYNVPNPAIRHRVRIGVTRTVSSPLSSATSERAFAALQRSRNVSGGVSGMSSWSTHPHVMQ